MRLTALILAGILILPLPAKGHTTEEKAEWKREWINSSTNDGYLTPSEISTYLSFTSKHREPIRLPAQASPSRKPPPTWSGSVEQWKPLIEQYFSPLNAVDWAMRVMHCESRGNPLALNSTTQAAGLMQVMPQWHTGVGWGHGPSPYGPFDPFIPEENIRFAAWLYSQPWGGPSQWACK